MTEKSIPQRTDSWEASLDLALKLNGRYGLPCIPDYGTTAKSPTKPLKRPILNGWQNLDAGTPDAIKTLWSQAKGRSQSYLVGVVCNGLLVIDIDTAAGHAAAADGSLMWDAWQNEYGATPTLTVRTQSGGMHVYYRLPESVAAANGTGKLAPGIDHKTTGGQVVAPGNVFAVGDEVRQYQVLEEGPAESGYIATVPNWLLYKVTNDKMDFDLDLDPIEEEARQDVDRQGLTGEARAKAIEERKAAILKKAMAGDDTSQDLDVDMDDAIDISLDGVEPYDGSRRRHASLKARTNGYIKRTLSNICQEIKAATDGVRNNTLNAGALRIMRIWQYGCQNNGADVPQDVVINALYEAGTATGQPPADVRKTIDSAIKGVARYPEPDAIKNLREKAERDQYGDLDASPVQRPAPASAVHSDAVYAPNTGISAQAAVNASAVAPASVPTATATAAATTDANQAQQNGQAMQAAASPTPTAQAPVQGQAPQQTTQPGPQPYDKWYYGLCGERLVGEDGRVTQGADWLAKRGISVETALKAQIGYDPICDPIGCPGGDPEEVSALDNDGLLHLSKRLIVPTTPTHFFAVSIDPTTPDKYKELSPKGSKAGLFFGAALRQQDGCVFVTDNWLSALSYMQVGAAAVATVTRKGATLLLERIDKEQTKATLILAYSNTAAGRATRDIVKGELRRRKVGYIVAGTEITGRGDADPSNVETPNDLLCNDADAFKAAVRKAQEETAPKPDNTQAYINSGEMFRDIAKARDAIPTGYGFLDQETGGLYPGLYVIGAISGLGKTTFCAQMADQIAAGGTDVVFISMEMSRLELVSKSLARITYAADHSNAWTSKNIRHHKWNSTVAQAAQEYVSKVGDRISIVEGNFHVDMEYISDYVRHLIERTGSRPVVFIDYLQIVQPSHSETKQTAKQQVDLCITEIKQLSRDLSIPIIVVSSLNRGSYLSQANFTAFKESGGIEYTADVIWGMQLACLNDREFIKSNPEERAEYINKEKDRPARHIQLRCLKNRYGRAYSAFFNYVPAYDYYEEITEEETVSLEGVDGYSKDLIERSISAPAATRRRKKGKGGDADADADAEEDALCSLPGFEGFEAYYKELHAGHGIEAAEIMNGGGDADA